jgi:hypothetical protein
MQALPLVHARIEALLSDEADKSARERSLEIIRGALGHEVAEMVLAETVPEYSPIEDALNAWSPSPDSITDCSGSKFAVQPQQSNGSQCPQCGLLARHSYN